METVFAVFLTVPGFPVAAFVAHGSDPFAKKELALLYLIGFSTLFLAGPGSYCVDKR